jgi:methionyl-tRNA formyltransferase
MARLVFLGTPDAAVPPLRRLVAAGHDLALVVTRADKKRGRGGALVPSPVKVAASELGLAVTDSLDAVAGVGAELGVVVAYGRIIPVAVLEQLPMVNLHFSLLPRWRGAAPVERAILEGDAETGVCLMAVEAGLDTGAIYAERSVVIGEGETADDLRARLVGVGCDLLDEHLRDGRAGLPRPRDQSGTPTYAEKIQPAELHLHWKRPAVELDRVVRLGRSWTTFRGRRLGIVRASVEDRAGDDQDDPGLPPGTLDGTGVVAGDGHRLRLVTVQPEGRRPMDVSDWRNGVHPGPGEVLGD